VSASDRFLPLIANFSASAFRRKDVKFQRGRIKGSMTFANASHLSPTSITHDLDQIRKDLKVAITDAIELNVVCDKGVF
jgi:hypothetical protein